MTYKCDLSGVGFAFDQVGLRNSSSSGWHVTPAHEMLHFTYQMLIEISLTEGLNEQETANLFDLFLPGFQQNCVEALTNSAANLLRFSNSSNSPISIDWFHSINSAQEGDLSSTCSSFASSSAETQLELGENVSMFPNLHCLQLKTNRSVHLESRCCFCKASSIYHSLIDPHNI